MIEFGESGDVRLNGRLLTNDADLIEALWSILPFRRADEKDWRRMYETEKAALESVALRADQLAKEHAGLRGQNARAFDTIAAQLARITELEAENAELRCDDALNVAEDRIAALESALRHFQRHAIIPSELGDGERIKVKP